MKITRFEIKDILSIFLQERDTIIAEQYISKNKAFILFRDNKEDYGDYIVLGGNYYTHITSYHSAIPIFKYDADKDNLYMMNDERIESPALIFTKPIEKMEIPLVLLGCETMRFSISMLCGKLYTYELGMDTDTKVVEPFDKYSKFEAGKNVEQLLFETEDEAISFLKQLSENDIIKDDSVFSLLLSQYLKIYNKSNYNEIVLRNLFSINRLDNAYPAKLNKENL